MLTLHHFLKKKKIPPNSNGLKLNVKRSKTTFESNTTESNISSKSNPNLIGNNSECQNYIVDSSSTKIETVNEQSKITKIPTITTSNKSEACKDTLIKSCFDLHLEPSWKKVLISEVSKKYFIQLDYFIKKEYSTQKIYPSTDEIFSAFNLCPFDTVKVVILGQDPYFNPGQAHGLAFSVKKGIQSPPSLRNIFKELKEDSHVDFSIENPSHNGNLSAWAAQGVLLLNSVLTVRAGQPNSHKNKGWEKFTDHVIRVLNDKKKSLVFLLWGTQATEKCHFLDQKKHLIIKSSHPSPLGATKTKFPFIGSKCFSICNEYLVKFNKEPIHWSL